MKRLMGTVVLALFLPVVAATQGGDYSKGHGYVYFGPGAALSSVQGEASAHVGGGGEGFLTKDVGLGADIGYLTPIRSWGDGIGTFSPNFVARFRAKDGKNIVEPFVAAATRCSSARHGQRRQFRRRSQLLVQSGTALVHRIPPVGLKCVSEKRRQEMAALVGGDQGSGRRA